MKIKHIFFYILTLCLLVPGYSQDNRTRVETIYTNWMNKNCGTTEGFKAIISDMITMADPLEPLFIQAYERGPDAALIRAFDVGSATRYKQMLEYIVSPDNILPPAEVNFYKNLNQEAYIKLERDNYIFSYKSNALAALGIIKREKGLGLLKSISEDLNSTFQHYAKLALDRPISN